MITVNKSEYSEFVSGNELSKLKGSHFDGENYIFFESEEEKEEFYSNIQSITSMPLNWRGLTESLYASPLFLKALSTASPNIYSTFLKIITDGEAGNSTENTLLNILNMMKDIFTSGEKSQLNTILEQNNFTVKV